MMRGTRATRTVVSIVPEVCSILLRFNQRRELSLSKALHRHSPLAQITATMYHSALCPLCPEPAYQGGVWQATDTLTTY